MKMYAVSASRVMAVIEGIDVPMCINTATWIYNGAYAVIDSLEGRKVSNKARRIESLSCYTFTQGHKVKTVTGTLVQLPDIVAACPEYFTSTFPGIHPDGHKVRVLILDNPDNTLAGLKVKIC